MDYSMVAGLLTEHADAVTALDDGAAAVALNSLTVTRTKADAWVRLRTLYGDANWTPTEVETLVAQLTAAAESNPVVARVLGWISQVGPDTGIDLSNAATRAQIQALATAGVITAAQAEKLLAMGVETVTMAEYFGRPLEAEDVRIGRL